MQAEQRLAVMSHTQLNQLLTKWQELQQQQNTEFDQIMEDDLEYRLKQLEQEEEEQYQHIEQVLELKLQEPEKNREELDEFERYCMKLIEEFDEQQPQQQQHIKLQQKEVEQPKHSHSQVARQQRTEKLQRQQRAQQVMDFGEVHRNKIRFLSLI